MSRGAKNLLVLGTASHTGKSVLVAGLCRLFRRRGISVAPFKAQNMALNSFVTQAGGEMGRAQVVQAEAAGIAPEVEMNPVLLKPSGQNRIQVILRGKVYGNMTAQEYYRQRSFFFQEVLACYSELSRRFELVLIEGAGSPVEMNLLDRDIVNLPLASALNAPCILVADIDRGGVFASLVGTRELCPPEHRPRIRGFVVNKFRGQEELFSDGVQFLERRTGWPCLGIIPHLDWLILEEEDSVALETKQSRVADPDGFRIAVIRLPHISNYTDFDPLEQSNARLKYTDRPEELTEADLIILPGTKNTLEDLLWLKSKGFEEALHQSVSSGALLMGICGGFQMLGREVCDPRRIESDSLAVAGLDLLDVKTVLAGEKVTKQVEGIHVGSGEPVRGYEIHMGRTCIGPGLAPFLRILRRGSQVTDEVEGATGGNVFGTYVHGIFENSGFARKFLGCVTQRRGKTFSFESRFFKEAMYDRWANVLEQKLRLEMLEQLIAAGE